MRPMGFFSGLMSDDQREKSILDNGIIVFSFDFHGATAIPSCMCNEGQLLAVWVWSRPGILLRFSLPRGSTEVCLA